MKRLSNSLVLFCFALVANLSYSQEMITLTTDKETYLTTNEFVARITNQSEQPAAYYRLSVQQLVNRQWLSIRSDTGCPCRSKCKKSPIELPHSKVVTEKWDFKDNQCDVVKKGEYRLVLLGAWDSAIKANRVIGQSSNFHIE